MTSELNAEQRFRLLYEQQQPVVLAYFLRRLPSDEAVEAASDVFTAAWRRIDTVPDGDDGRRWLFGVSRNVLRNHARSTRRWTRLIAKAGSMPAESGGDPESAAMRKATDRAALEALAMVGTRDREILVLRLWDEMEFRDIAALQHCSRHAAEQRYARALQRLRSAFRKSGHEEPETGSGERPAESRQEEQTRGA